MYYEIADKGVVELLYQGEELARRVGPLIEACPRYRQAGARRTAGRAREAGSGDGDARVHGPELDCADEARRSKAHSGGSAAWRRPDGGEHPEGDRRVRP